MNCKTWECKFLRLVETGSRYPFYQPNVALHLGMTRLVSLKKIASLFYQSFSEYVFKIFTMYVFSKYFIIF